MKPFNGFFSRRQFLQTAGTITAVGLFSGHLRGLAADKTNPFAYDVSRFSKTDPALIKFEEVLRFPSPEPEPRRIAAGPGDTLLLACKSGICVVKPSGESQLKIPLASPARAVCAAPDGTIYAASRDRIEVFKPEGTRLASWESPGPKTWFTGLAAGADRVLAADAGNRCILGFDRSGKLLKRIGVKDKEHNIPGLIVPSPYLDVALGRDGLLRVNNPGRHCVEVYTIDGELELSWGKPSASISGFCGCCNPVSVTMLPDGSCITAEKGLPRVKIYSPQGEFLSVVAGAESFPGNGRPGSTQDLSDGTMGGLDTAVRDDGSIFVLDITAATVRVMKRKAGA